MGNLSVRECVFKVYQAARDGSSDLENLLKRLKTTEQRKTALETKTKDGSHFVTPLIVAAHTPEFCEDSSRIWSRHRCSRNT